MLTFLTQKMILAKEKINAFPGLFDDYLFKALNPYLTLDEKLVYIHKLQLHITILSGMLNDIEKEIRDDYDQNSRMNSST